MEESTTFNIVDDFKKLFDHYYSKEQVEKRNKLYNSELERTYARASGVMYHAGICDENGIIKPEYKNLLK